MPMGFDVVVARSRAICLRQAQKLSSRLMLVLCFPMTIERFFTLEFMQLPHEYRG
jgi:hypothetical protein